MTGYDLDRLYREMAFIAYHFHWSQGTLMSLEHRDRQRWCREISRIHQELGGAREVPLTL